MGLFSGFGHHAFISDQKILSCGPVEMLLKKFSEDLRPRDGDVEKTLHGPVFAAFSGPAGETQHRHPTSHTQHGLDDPAQATHIRRGEIGLYTL